MHADAAELALAAEAPRFSGLPALPACLRVLSHLLLALLYLWLQSHLRHAHRAAHHASVLHPDGAVKKPDKLFVLAVAGQPQLSDAGWMEQEGDRRGDKRTAATARTCRGGGREEVNS